MFLLSDTQIINETFLEDINNILNAGEARGKEAYKGSDERNELELLRVAREVPNLFPNDEIDRVIADTRRGA